MADFNMNMFVGEERVISVATLFTDNTRQILEIAPRWSVSDKALADIFDASGDRTSVKVRAMAAGTVTITVVGQVNATPVVRTLDITITAPAAATPSDLSIRADGNPIGKTYQSNGNNGET